MFLYNQDFLELNLKEKYDLILGNPPYFVYNKIILIRNIINILKVDQIFSYHLY